MAELHMHNGDGAHILLVEDNPGDARLAEEAFHTADVRDQIHVVEDGYEAMDFLHQEGGYSRAPRPDLILLDLNLPGKSGHEVLAEVKSDQQLRHIPIVVFSSSQAEQDVHKAYELQANCYVVKPPSFQEAVDLARHP